MPQPQISETNFSTANAWKILKKEVLNPWTPKTLTLLKEKEEISQYIVQKNYSKLNNETQLRNTEKSFFSQIKKNSEIGRSVFDEKNEMLSGILYILFFFISIHYSEKSFEKENDKIVDNNEFISKLNIRRKSCHNEKLFGDVSHKEKFIPLSSQTNNVTAMQIKQQKNKEASDQKIQITINDETNPNNYLKKKNNTLVVNNKINDRSLNGSFVSTRTPCEITKFFII